MTTDIKTLAKMAITQMGVNGKSAEVPYEPKKARDVVDHLNSALGSTALCDHKFRLEEKGSICEIKCDKPLEQSTIQVILLGDSVKTREADAHTKRLEILRNFQFNSSKAQAA